MNIENIERLKEIHQEMRDLMEEARNILRDAPRPVQERAIAYWVPHILQALDDDNDFVGKSMCSMQDTINDVDTTEEIICPSCGETIKICADDKECPDCGEALPEPE